MRFVWAAAFLAFGLGTHAGFWAGVVSAALQRPAGGAVVLRLDGAGAPSTPVRLASADWAAFLPTPHDTAGAQPATPAQRKGRVAIVIDDLGPAAAPTAAALALPSTVTLAFLPDRASAAWASRARAEGHEILLHMPMQAAGTKGDRATLDPADPADRNVGRLVAALARVPGAIGFNNHEGSLFTADAVALRPVLAEAQRRGLLFLDSRTTPETRAELVGRSLGLTVARRDVFLDHEPTPEAISRQIAAVERLALSRGDVVAIGHPHPATIAALAAWMPAAETRGISFVGISAIAAAAPVVAARVPPAPGSDLP